MFNYLTALGSRFFTFEELKSAYHRLSNPAVPLRSLGSRVAYVGLRTARQLGALPDLHRRYVATKPLIPANAPPSHIYDAQFLHLKLNRVYDMPEVELDDDRPRSINVLVPAFEFRSMSAGFFGVFQVALFFARLGHHVRLVMFDNFYFNAEEFRSRLKGYPGLEELFDLCETEYIGERRAALRVNEDDICVASVWYSAFFADKIHRKLRRKDFIYLIQDHETAFYPGGSSSTQAELSYEFDYTALFSSESLRDHFLTRDIGGIRSRGLRHTFFNNACSALLPPREAFIREKRGRRKKRLVFYSRPVVDRNMFDLTALVLCEAYSRGIVNPEDWDCIGMGLGEGVVQLAPGHTSISLPRMNLQEYLDTVSSFDVCLTLMASPHPSMIPMDLALSGALVVTNTLGSKTPAYLTGLSGNIIPARPSLEDLLDALRQAVARADDAEARYEAAEASRYPRTWSQTFTDDHERFFRGVLDAAHPDVEAPTAERTPVAGQAGGPAPTLTLFPAPAVELPQRTYVIVGNGRGGTSMVAGVASAIGVPLMPPSADSLNHEDTEIVNSAQGRDELQRDLGLTDGERLEGLLSIIRRRNAAADVWGWKDPSADLYLEDILDELRNPRLVFVCRDIAAVAGAHMAINGSDLMSAMEEATARQDRYWALARRLQIPTLVVSYERGRRAPQEMLDGLAGFMGYPATDDLRRRVERFVSPTGGYRTLSGAASAEAGALSHYGGR